MCRGSRTCSTSITTAPAPATATCSLRNEREYSAYSFEQADTTRLARHFADAEAECAALLTARLPLPAYDQCIKASHLFNLLDARGVIAVAERAAYIGRVRTLAKGCCEGYLAEDTVAAPQTGG